MNIFAQNFKIGNHFFERRVNTSQYVDVAEMTGASSENIPDLETILKEQKF